VHSVGKPNGVARALIARHKRPGAARIRPTRGRVGEFMPVPIDLPELVATVG
jgi:hypothetical protein